MGAVLTLMSSTLLVTVCPTGTAPKLIAPGETLSGPVADEFGEYPQPDNATAAQDTNTTNKRVHRPSNLWIALGLKAQFKLNNVAPLCKTCKFSRGR
jgi:hypothetical protein